MPAHQAEQQQHGGQAGQGERKPRGQRGLSQRFEAHRRNREQTPRLPLPGGIRLELPAVEVILYGRLGIGGRPADGIVVIVVHIGGDQVHAVVGQRPPKLEHAGGEHRGGGLVLPKVSVR